MRLVSYCTVHQSLLGESLRLCHSFAVASYHLGVGSASGFF